jgi:glycosyltransferase involved in cell wall biosynthesis
VISKMLNSKANIKNEIHRTFDHNAKPLITVIVPVFNQEEVIFKHLESIAFNMFHDFEFIIVNDNSFDQSSREVKRFMEFLTAMPRKCKKISFFETRWPWFESRCDDFAIRNASGDFILEIQADMYIKEKYFDGRLITLLTSNPNLFAISCRGTQTLDPILRDLRENHGRIMNDRIINLKTIRAFFSKIKLGTLTFFLNALSKRKNLKYFNNSVQVHDSVKPSNIKETLEKIFPDLSHGLTFDEAGFIGNLIDLLPYDSFSEISAQVELRFNRIWVGDTIMRGPLFFSKKDYLEVGGFSTNAFFLGYDDHDLFLRVKKQGKTVGFTPIHFSSPSTLGNTRMRKSVSSKFWNKLHLFARRKHFFSSELYKEAVKNLG